MKFFIVPAEIVAQWQGAQAGDKGLYFVQDMQGRYVVNTGVAADWPMIPWQDFEIVTLTVEDFPTPENE